MDTLDVLVVEDMIVAQKITTIHMVAQGCTVDVAADGATAIQKADRVPYDVILMDIGLGGGMNGFEVTRAIKTYSIYNKNTLVMAMTAHEEIHYLDKGFSCGMDWYFQKPLTAQLAKDIVEYIQNKRKFS